MISPVPIDNNNNMTHTIDALSNTTPSVHNAKINQVSSETDRDIQVFVPTDDAKNSMTITTNPKPWNSSPWSFISYKNKSQ